MRSLIHFCCAALAACALVFVFSAGNRAAAQTARPAPPPPVPVETAVQVADEGQPPATAGMELAVIEPQTYTLKFQGAQTSAGITDYNTDVLTGLSYAGDVTGALTGAFSLALRQKEVTPNVEKGNQLAGDTWSLVVFQGNACQGVLYGEVSSGQLTWTSKDGAATMSGELVVTGGTGTFTKIDPAQAKGSFKLGRTVDSNGHMVAAGTVELTF